LLGVSDNYLYRIERGMRQPGFELIQQISAVMGVPIGKLVGEQVGMTEGSNPGMCERGCPLADIKDQFTRDRDSLISAEKDNRELKQTVEHLSVLIDLHVRFENIVCDNSLSQSEKMKKLGELAKTAAKEGKASFEEIRIILRIKRATLKKLLRSAKQAYPCVFVEGSEILALTPGGAALQLRCFDCKAFESGECKGYGNEKRPENIIGLVSRLEANGILSRIEQSQIISKSYDTPISEHELSEVIYRYNHDQPIPEGIFYLDRRKKRQRRHS
jgi:transcriptional regulator with XRE-family HTH domain